MGGCRRDFARAMNRSRYHELNEGRKTMPSPTIQQILKLRLAVSVVLVSGALANAAPGGQPSLRCRHTSLPCQHARPALNRRDTGHGMDC